MILLPIKLNDLHIILYEYGVSFFYCILKFYAFFYRAWLEPESLLAQLLYTNVCCVVEKDARENVEESYW